MRRAACVIALLLVVPAAGTAGPPVGRTQTILATRTPITYFAQDGAWIAYATKGRRCGPHVHLLSLRTHRIVNIPATGYSVTCDVYSGLAVAGGTALWTNLVGAGNTELDVAIETATASRPRARRVREMAMMRTDFGPDPATPVVAGRGSLLVYYRNESGILGSPAHVVERLARPRWKAVFRAVDPAALAVDVGRVASVRRQLVRGDACNCNFAPEWSPDGTKIAFVSGHVYDGDSDGSADVYTVDAGGSGKLRITNDGRPKIGIAWSPDGKRLAYGYLNTHRVPTVAIVNVDGGGAHDVVTGANPSFSPEGSRLVFDAGGQIETANVDGSNLQTLAAGTNPAWSPDGTTIAYEAAAGVRTMRTDGGDQLGVAPLMKGPAWSPDGTALAGSATSKHTGLFVTSPQGFIPGTQPSDANPSWSPDGTHLVFDSLRNDLFRGADQRPELYVSRIDGSDLHPLLYTQPDEWSSEIQVHAASGRLVSTAIAQGAPLGVALSGRYVVALTQAAHTGAKAFEIFDAGSGKELRTLPLGWTGATGPLYARNGRLVYRAGRTLMALDLGSGSRRRLAVVRGTISGLGLWGNRFYWADNDDRGGSIRSLAIPR